MTSRISRHHHYVPNSSGTGQCDRCGLPARDVVHGDSGRGVASIEEAIIEARKTMVFMPDIPYTAVYDEDAEREKGIRQMLRALGEDPDREGLKDTPRRVLKAWSELCGGYKMEPRKMLTVFDAEGHDEMVSVGPIRFYSTCEHHLLPFWGDAWVSYLPTAKIIGLSKLPRIVEIFARRLQNQERMTRQIATTLLELIEPLGAGVLVRGKHMCSMARGVRQDNTVMTTTWLAGKYRSDPAVRAEFLGGAK